MPFNLSSTACPSLPRSRFRWAWALGASAAVLILLIIPWVPQWGGRYAVGLGRSAHVLLFAGLAWLWGQVLSNTNRGGKAWGVWVIVAGGVEWIQSITGRSPSVLDWLLGASGAGYVCGSWRIRPGVIRAVGLILLAMAPPAWEWGMVRMEVKAFPVLARPGAIWAQRSWERNGVAVSHEGRTHFRIEKADTALPNTYPGLFRKPARQDWRGVKQLTTDVYWPGPESAVLVVRVDDRPGNPPYWDRFQREMNITQGWNRIWIPAAELAATSGGRPMNLQRISLWGVFLVGTESFDYVLLGPVELELEPER